MRMTHLSVENYRSLREVHIPLSRFGCLIGENNAGKSTVLQAISLFFTGNRLVSSNYFEDGKPIRIAITFDGITDADIARLAPEHRERTRTMLRNGRVTLVRRYDPDGKGELKYIARIPTEQRFSEENVAALLRGERPGAAFLGRVLERFPELEGRVTAAANQEAVREQIDLLAQGIPDEQKTSADRDLHTGLDRSITTLLPDPIYVPAVKDLADDIKTSESSPFGKVLSILLPLVEAQLPAMQTLFRQLDVSLNRQVNADGLVQDNRLEALRTIESTIEDFVQQCFANVALHISIPPPELKTVFAGARISANDGVHGAIETKGDGLKRAVVFSILRTYVQLRNRIHPSHTEGDPDYAAELQPAPRPFVLLFEEPELFLHPKAQRILFDTLKSFAADHHVIVTTHSPSFLAPNATETFMKVRKVSDPVLTAKPFSVIAPIDLSDVRTRDQFHLICFENNNAAFFADTVVLVEGVSDFLLMPHIARTIDQRWDVARLPLLFVQITGKGNIGTYKEFFGRFGIRVMVVCDLDVIVDGFRQLGAPDEVGRTRSRLLVAIDASMVEPGAEQPAAEAREAARSGELRGLWNRVLEATRRVRAGEGTAQDLEVAMNDFYGWQRRKDRLEVLKRGNADGVAPLKGQLLSELRALGVFVWDRGCIEDYYPETVSGQDKPSKAINFCSRVTTREAVLDCCGDVQVQGGDAMTQENEFLVVFNGLFSHLVE